MCRQLKLSDHTARAVDFIGRLVVLKMLPPELAREARLRERFLSEISVSLRVSHPNVITCYEAFDEEDLCGYTMEYVQGGTLEDRLRGGSRVGLPQALSLLTQLTSGVHALHERGVIHHDLKPSNILLSPEGVPKIVDFGISRDEVYGDSERHKTIVGTANYISPEYLKSGIPSRQSDIYSLGVIAYQMIAGQLPFAGENSFQTMALRLCSDPVWVHEVRPECPLVVSRAIHRALERDPANRYKRVRDFRAALLRAKRRSWIGLLMQRFSG